MTSATYITFPDILASWPWPRAVNPRYAEAKAASTEWLAGFDCFSPKVQKAFDICDFSLLASHVYPTAEADIIRLGCDLMNIFFLYDEFSDSGDAEYARKLAEIAMEATRTPHKPRPEGEPSIGEIIRQFSERVAARVSAETFQRFIDASERFTASVVEEARDRTNAHVRSIQNYLALRRRTAGAEPSFCVIEFGLDIPDVVFEHPVMKKLQAAAADMLVITNDMYSFNVEQARGDPHNLITSVMHELSVDINGAFDWATSYYRELCTSFLDIHPGGLPSFGPEVDPHVIRYVEGLAHWVRGLDEWSFETQRYFGTKGEAVKVSRRVELLPKRAAV